MYIHSSCFENRPILHYEMHRICIHLKNQDFSTILHWSSLLSWTELQQQLFFFNTICKIFFANQQILALNWTQIYYHFPDISEWTIISNNSYWKTSALYTKMLYSYNLSYNTEKVLYQHICSFYTIRKKNPLAVRYVIIGEIVFSRCRTPDVPIHKNNERHFIKEKKAFILHNKWNEKNISK